VQPCQQKVYSGAQRQIHLQKYSFVDLGSATQLVGRRSNSTVLPAGHNGLVLQRGLLNAKDSQYVDSKNAAPQRNVRDALEKLRGYGQYDFTRRKH
jgi:hypothetical protein